MPVDVKGLFVLTLKFSEVYFERPGQKVFSVMLNDHTIIKDLDVFKKVGKNAAYDRQVEFRVSNSSSEIIFESAKGSSKPAVSVPYDGTLTVRFVSSGYVSPRAPAALRDPTHGCWGPIAPLGAPRSGQFAEVCAHPSSDVG